MHCHMTKDQKYAARRGEASRTGLTNDRIPCGIVTILVHNTFADSNRNPGAAADHCQCGTGSMYNWQLYYNSTCRTNLYRSTVAVPTCQTAGTAPVQHGHEDDCVERNQTSWHYQVGSPPPLLLNSGNKRACKRILSPLVSEASSLVNTRVQSFRLACASYPTRHVWFLREQTTQSSPRWCLFSSPRPAIPTMATPSPRLSLSSPYSRRFSARSS